MLFSLCIKDPREKLILTLKREIKVLRNENHYLRQQVSSLLSEDILLITYKKYQLIHSFNYLIDILHSNQAYFTFFKLNHHYGGKKTGQEAMMIRRMLEDLLN